MLFELDVRDVLPAITVPTLVVNRDVLVSRTIRDLVAGSGLAFVDRGTHTLKGVPEEWQVLEGSE